MNKETGLPIVAWCGINTNDGNQISTKRDSLNLIPGQGITGERHQGATWRLDARLEKLFENYRAYTPAMTVMNWRQVTVISGSELRRIGENLGLYLNNRLASPNTIPFGLLGENVVIDGLDNLTSTPSGNILVFKNGQRELRSMLWIMAENQPCIIPGKNIADHFKIPALANKFAEAAKGLRGIVCNAFTAGQIKPGYRVEIAPLLQP